MPHLGPDAKRRNVQFPQILKLQCNQDCPIDVILDEALSHLKLNASMEHGLRDHLRAPINECRQIEFLFGVLLWGVAARELSLDEMLWNSPSDLWGDGRQSQDNIIVGGEGRRNK